MQDLITTSPSTQDIWNLARVEGSRSLFEDGILKVKNGVTTIEELLRVAEPPKSIMKGVAAVKENPVEKTIKTSVKKSVSSPKKKASVSKKRA